MKIKCLFHIALLLAALSSAGQETLIDSLVNEVHKHAINDTLRVKALETLTNALNDAGSDSALIIGQQALELAKILQDYPRQILIYNDLGNYYLNHGKYAEALASQNKELETASKIGDSLSIARSYFDMANVYLTQSDNLKALQYYTRALGIYERIGAEASIAGVYTNIGVIYQDMQDPKMAQSYYEKALPAYEKSKNKKRLAIILNNLGGVYLDQGQTVKAIQTFDRALNLSNSAGNLAGAALILRNRGSAKAKLGKLTEALDDFYHALELFLKVDDTGGLADLYYAFGNTYLEMNKADSAIYYSTKSLKLAQQTGFYRNIYDTYDDLSKGYALKGNFAKSYTFLRKAMIAKDSAMGVDKQNLMAETKFNYELDKKQTQIALLTKDKLLKEQEAKQQRTKAYGFLASLLLVCVLAAVLIINNRKKQKTNAILQSQKNEIERTLTDLKNTQAQLIQSEKMASLGQLTSGIAHEIQNPLNFVNNFSAINVELLEEYIHEMNNGKNTNHEILKNIRDNELRVVQYGQRADNIVKGMLQHARPSGGEKRSVDLSGIINEYLKVGYNAFRLKHPDFTAKLEAHFEREMPRVFLNIQDIATVFLNVFNNAFYSMHEKKRMNSNLPYHPSLEISIKSTDENVQILIKDNGMGIPSGVGEKIFHPFFTTKPAGEGVGLGLSITYDIITVNGGSIEVYRSDHDSTTFRIILPYGMA